MDTGTIFGIVGIVIGVVGLAVGVAFGIDGRRSAQRTQSKLDAVLRLIREANPEAVAALVTEAAPLGAEQTDAQKKVLADAIARLPEREKLVVTLYYYEELSLAEIADVLDTIPEEVSALHSKALKQLRAALNDGDKGPWVEFW